MNEANYGVRQKKVSEILTPLILVIIEWNFIVLR